MVRLTDPQGRLPSGTVLAPVIAIVTDNDDPDELGRVRVKFPTLEGGEIESWWLRQATPNAGKERGLYALPEIEDEVLVVFLHGDPDQGVVIGQLWNGVDLRPHEAKDKMPGSGKTDTGSKKATAKFADGSADDADNDRRFWRSRSGHLFVFDDTDGKETIQVWDGGHTLCLAFDTQAKLITLSNTEGDIEIRTKNDLKLEAGNDIIVMAGRHIDGESKENTTHQAGKNITVSSKLDTKFTADANFSAKASKTLSCRAGTSATFKGDVDVTIQGGSKAVVKAGTVLIN